jgi:hypothetical protein
MDGTLPTRPAAFWKHPGLGSINKVLKNDAENGCIIDPRSHRGTSSRNGSPC